ncbi:MAG: electron transfer flavoprotein subunit beta/FixA family protein [Lentisphaerae bacterium]|jgi:electron transfer flavoprotein beta subunit|nr:electron transfer flavoprotein subunit beta/FixA family protein [Lentisphaerota bacterium]
MKIIVCIKQVPDTTDVKINPETNTLIREGVVSITNPYDMYAIEAALQIKALAGGDSTVTALSMGPPQAEAILRDAISMGVDSGILLSDRAFAGADTWATSYALSKAIEHIGDVDLIVFGKQAADGDTAQVGPGVATHLDLPQITYVRKLGEITSETITAERMLEDGNETIKSQLPCVMTVVKEIGEPRLPSLRGKMAAKKAEITVWKAEDIGCEPDKCGLNGSPTKVVKIFTPAARGTGEIFTGEPHEAVNALVEKLIPVIVGASN